MVRLLAIAEREIESAELFCKSDKQRSRATIRLTDESIGCPLAAYTIDCPVDVEPRWFALFGDADEMHEAKQQKLRMQKTIFFCWNFVFRLK